MANISSIKAASLSMCFSVGAVLFSSHAGGGFATGNQENVYFVSLGWLGPITAIITMLLFTLTIKEAMNMYRTYTAPSKALNTSSKPSFISWS